MCLCYFWKNKSLFVSQVFLSENLEQVFEGCIFSKAPDGKLLLLLKMKIKQNLGKNAIFKHIHQVSRPIPDVKNVH